MSAVISSGSRVDAMLMDEEAFAVVDAEFEEAKRNYYKAMASGLEAFVVNAIRARFDVVETLRGKLFPIKEQTVVLQRGQRLENYVLCHAVNWATGGWLGDWRLPVGPVVGDRISRSTGEYKVVSRVVEDLGLRLEVEVIRVKQETERFEGRQ